MKIIEKYETNCYFLFEKMNLTAFWQHILQSVILLTLPTA